MLSMGRVNREIFDHAGEIWYLHVCSRARCVMHVCRAQYAFSFVSSVVFYFCDQQHWGFDGK